MHRSLWVALAFVACLTPLRAEKWQVQYFYDQGKSNLLINDLQFASPHRGVAVGVIVKEGRRQEPVAVVTSNGGANWDTVPLKETPVSLFFLNENLGWMVTEKGLWQTTEAGRNWRKLPKLPAPANRVYFADEKTGWAVCGKKTVLETHNGGDTWTPVAAATSQPGSKESSGFNWIAFATPQFGIISGYNHPQHLFHEFPAWMDPEDALSRRETPHLTYTLVTRDGGQTWKSSAASLIGDVTRIRFNQHGLGVGLIEYSESFRYPSEAYKVDWTTGKSVSIFHDKRFAISDVWMMADGTVYLAGIAVSGELRSVVPGRVQVLRSRDLSTWTQMEVDYRAVARQVTFSATDADNLWLATENGMILKLK